MKQWNIRAKSNGRDNLLRALFDVRGVSYQPDVSLELLEPPEFLPDIDIAAERILDAIENGEKITVYGDFDVDGITSTALLVSWLRNNGADCDYYIPARRGEGYGIHPEAIDKIHARGTTLIVSVDCGVTNFEAAERAAELEIDLIITDHHEVREQLPNALAVVNPMRNDYDGDSDMAGVGVAFQLIRLLEGDDEAAFEQYGALPALGTIADIVPLGLHNRILVRHGLELFHKSVGINALLKQSNAAGRLTATTIAFLLAPRINAAGRMGHTDVAVELLLTNDENEAAQLAQTLDNLNAERKAVEAQLHKQAVRDLEEQADWPIHFLVGYDWHPGVIGIVASRLLEQTNKPVFMVSVEDGKGKGSSRAPQSSVHNNENGWRLVDFLAANEGLLLNYGGHELAAGFVVSEENIPALREGLLRYARENPAEMAQDVLNIDMELCAVDLTLNNARALQLGEPWGKGNESPIFCLRNVNVDSITAIGGGKHAKFVLNYVDMAVSAIWFGTNGSSFKKGDCIDVAFALDVNHFRGVDSLQLMIHDMRHSENDELRIRLSDATQLDIISAIIKQHHGTTRVAVYHEGKRFIGMTCTITTDLLSQLNEVLGEENVKVASC